MKFSAGANGDGAPEMTFPLPPGTLGSSIAADNDGNVYTGFEDELAAYPRPWSLSIQVFTPTYGSFPIALPSHSGDYLGAITTGP
jgi:hypothetical protein